MENHYKTLGVEITATQEEIKSQFRYLVQSCHPDKFQAEGHKKKAAIQYKKIINAYEVLNDLNTKKIYDKELSIYLDTNSSDYTNQIEVTENITMLSIVIDIANNVISALIVNYALSKQKKINKAMLEEKVIEEIINTVLCDKNQINIIANKVIEEIEFLSKKASILKINDDYLEFISSRNRFALKKDDPNKLITKKLDELNNLVNQRRVELGLPTRAVPLKSSIESLSKTDIPSGWQKIDNGEKMPSFWEKEVIIMKDRINERRKKL